MIQSVCIYTYIGSQWLSSTRDVNHPVHYVDVPNGKFLSHIKQHVARSTETSCQVSRARTPYTTTLAPHNRLTTILILISGPHFFCICLFKTIRREGHLVQLMVINAYAVYFRSTTEIVSIKNLTLHLNTCNNILQHQNEGYFFQYTYFMRILSFYQIIKHPANFHFPKSISINYTTCIFRTHSYSTF